MATRKSNKRGDTSRNYGRKKALSIKDLKVDNFVRNADKPISVLVGLLAGAPIAIWIDKQMTAKKIFGMDGDKLKKWVKPGANFILGMSVNLLAKDPRVKLAGIGLAANGGLLAVKELLGGKDLLKGLVEGVNGTKGIGSSTYRILSSSAGRGISSPLNLPLLAIDEPSAEATEMIERSIAENSDVEGIGRSKGIQLGKTAAQLAGENEPVVNSNDTEMDVIP